MQTAASRASEEGKRGKDQDSKREADLGKLSERAGHDFRVTGYRPDIGFGSG